MPDYAYQRRGKRRFDTDDEPSFAKRDRHRRRLRPLDEFDVTLGPDEPAALLSVRGDVSTAGRWAMHEISAPAGFASALAVEGSDGVVFVR